MISGGGGRHFWFGIAGLFHRPPAGSLPASIPAATAATSSRRRACIQPVAATRFLSYDELADAPEWLERLARTKPQSISERAIAQVDLRRPDNFRPARPMPTDQAALDAEIDEPRRRAPRHAQQRAQPLRASGCFNWSPAANLARPRSSSA